jgi:hypothetical protein
MESSLKRRISDKEFGAARYFVSLLKIKGVINFVKRVFNVDPRLSFFKSHVDAKTRAIELLEEMAAPYIPLRACHGSWGAYLLLKFYWQNIQGNSKITKII